MAERSTSARACLAAAYPVGRLATGADEHGAGKRTEKRRYASSDPTQLHVVRRTIGAGGARLSGVSGGFGEQTAEGFGWSNMFVSPEDDPRADGGFHGERETLMGFLRDQQLTFELKCSGLDAEQLARRSVPPSAMSLLGLVRHLAAVEQRWFRLRMAGEDHPRHFRSGADRNEDFNGAVSDDEVVRSAWELWRSEVAFAEAYVSEADSAEKVGESGDVLGEVLVHMIAEYARHNGHADLLRECIDGRRGQ